MPSSTKRGHESLARNASWAAGLESITDHQPDLEEVQEGSVELCRKQCSRPRPLSPPAKSWANCSRLVVTHLCNSLVRIILEPRVNALLHFVLAQPGRRLP